MATLGRATFLGADPGLASLYDLGLLSLMYGTTTGFLHSLAIQRSEGGRGRGVYLEHMIDATERRGIDPTFPAHVKKLMDGAIAAGHGGDDVARMLNELATSTRTSA